MFETMNLVKDSTWKSDVFAVLFTRLEANRLKIGPIGRIDLSLGR